MSNLNHDTSMSFTKTNKALSTQHGTPLKFVSEHAFPCRYVSKLGQLYKRMSEDVIINVFYMKYLWQVILRVEQEISESLENLTAMLKSGHLRNHPEDAEI